MTGTAADEITTGKNACGTSGRTAGILAGIAFTGTRARDTLVFVGKSSEAPLSKCRGMIPFSCRE
jgi:hypothetical protein